MYTVLSIVPIILLSFMKKIIPSLMALSCVLLLSSCGNTNTGSAPETASEVDALKNSQPEARADIQGTVKSIVGNEFTIETIDMSSSETMKQMQDPEFRTKMQAMSDTERQAMMTKMQEERANAKRVLVNVTIPVGVPILVRTGGRGGFPGGGFPRGGGAPGGSTQGIGSSLGGTTNTNAQRPTPTGKQGTIADIKVGSTVSVWLAPDMGERKIATWVSASAGQTGGNTSGGFGGGGQVPAGR